MRLYKREIRDPKLLEEILKECQVVRIGFADEEGMMIVPVNFGYDFSVSQGIPGLKLYIHGAGEGRKARAFARDSRVAVEMDCRHGLITGDYTCSYSYSYRSIMGNGQIRPLENAQDKIYGLTRILEHIAPETKISFQPSMLERTAVYCIDVHTFTGKERRQEAV